MVPPASAQTQQQDAVLLARTLADGLTAIDARQADARAAVEAWDAEQVRCATPRLKSGFERSEFRFLRGETRRSVAWRAMAPELRQLVSDLKALPVTDPAIRGGIEEVRLDYRNVRESIGVDAPSLYRVVRKLQSDGTVSKDGKNLRILAEAPAAS